MLDFTEPVYIEKEMAIIGVRVDGCSPYCHKTLSGLKETYLFRVQPGVKNVVFSNLHMMNVSVSAQTPLPKPTNPIIPGEY